MELIDKAAVVAEIERRKHKLLDHIICESDKEWVVRTVHQLNIILLFLDTLEVKEVDLNKEISQFIDANFEKATIGHKLSLRRIARHFYELGFKAQKGE